MKKKIIIMAAFLIVTFFICFLYIILNIQQGTTRLHDLITLHKVELLRENFLLQVKRVQSDLQVKNTRYARSVDTVVNNIINMDQMADTCYDCHHSEEMVAEFNELKDTIALYKSAISRLFTTRANITRLEDEEDRAYQIGENLVEMVDDMINISSTKLEAKTQEELKKIADTKIILFLMLAFGPLAIVAIAILLIKDITNPLHKLDEATSKLRQGDLDFKIEGMKDEFGTVAESFNAMSDSLKSSMRSIRESENRYRMLFESAGDAIFMIEASGAHTGNIVSANPAAQKLYGYTIEELLRLNLINDIHEQATEGDPPLYMQHIMNGSWVSKELNHRKKDGTIFPVEASAGLLEHMDHKYILVFVRDISSRKKAEHKLRESEMRYAEAAHAAQLGHWERDLVTMSGYWSSEMYTIFGVDRDAFVPSFDNFISFVHPDDKNSVVDAFKDSVMAGKELKLEFRIIRPDGGQRYIQSRALIIIDEHNKRRIMTGTLQDITERKRNEDALLRSYIIFTTVLDSIDAIIYVSDIETNEILYMNYHAKDILGNLEGKIREEFLKNDCTDEKILTEDGQPQTRTCTCEFYNTMNNRWYDVRVRAVEWVNGHIVRMEIANDFTDRKATSDRIKEYIEFLETLMNTIPLPIFYKNEKGEYTGCNRAFEEFVGLTEADLVGKTVYDMGPKEIADTYYTKDKELFDNPGQQVYEWQVKRKDGQQRDVIFFKATFEGADGKVAGLIGTILDITERKTLEQKLRRAEQMRLVGEWAAGLAHEIKNSLAGIKISVEVLTAEYQLPEEDEEAVLKAIDEIKRIELLLKSLLNFAKPPDLHISSTDINQILDHTIQFVLKQSSPVSKKMPHINVQKDFAENLPAIMCDQLQIKQVFINILLNARDAMEGSGTLNIRTYLEKEDNAIYVIISDTGKGINKKSLNKIFEPFYTTKSKGTGLGLAITKRIINQHGGTVQAENRPGGGAIFTVVLPVISITK